MQPPSPNSERKRRWQDWSVGEWFDWIIRRYWQALLFGEWYTLNVLPTKQPPLNWCVETVTVMIIGIGAVELALVIREWKRFVVWHWQQRQKCK